MFTAIQSVLAIIVVVAFGFYAGKRKIVSNELSGSFSTLVMQFTFPAVLFTSIAQTSVDKLLNIRFLIAFFFSLMTLYFVVFIISNKVLKRSPQVSAMVAFTCSFPNMAFMGIPYLTEVLGSDTLLSVAIGNVISSVVMIPLTVLFLEKNTSAGPSTNVFKRELMKLIKKPLIIAPVLGIIVAFLHIPMPQFFMKGLHILGEATSPVALFTLGLMMTKFKFKLSLDAVADMGLKLIIQPLSAIAFVLIFGLSGKFAAEIIILTAMPTAVIVSMFSEKYNVYKEETVSAIIGGSVLSIITLVIFTVLSPS